jgi:putative SOS response-associated peptidase YedK
MFKEAFESRHCLVPANSYFEWMRTSWLKQPYRIMLKDESIFAMAGIYEKSHSADPHPTFAILTTSATPLLRKIHDRMPVILRRDDEQLWLKVAAPNTFYQLDDHYPEEQITSYPVTRKMNKVGFNNPEAWLPIEEPTLGI